MGPPIQQDLGLAACVCLPLPCSSGKGAVWGAPRGALMARTFWGPSLLLRMRDDERSSKTGSVWLGCLGVAIRSLTMMTPGCGAGPLSRSRSAGETMEQSHAGTQASTTAARPLWRCKILAVCLRRLQTYLPADLSSTCMGPIFLCMGPIFLGEAYPNADGARNPRADRTSSGPLGHGVEAWRMIALLPDTTPH